MRREVCEFRWLHITYDEVRDLLREQSLELLQPAAEIGYRRGGEALTTLSTDMAGVHLERNVVVEVGQQTEIGPPLPIIKVPVRWHASDHPGMYPLMDAVLEAYPITGDRTQLSIQGHYEPPLGRMGAALDSLVLHRIAETTVEHFLEAIAHRIEDAWKASKGPPPAGPRPLTEPETASPD